MFSGHREQEFEVALLDLGPQRPAECAAATRPVDAVGLSCLSLPLPAEPRPSARALSVNHKPTVGTYNYTYQCTGNLSSPAPDTRPYRGWRLPHSFL